MSNSWKRTPLRFDLFGLLTQSLFICLNPSTSPPLHHLPSTPLPHHLCVFVANTFLSLLPSSVPTCSLRFLLLLYLPNILPLLFLQSQLFNCGQLFSPLLWPSYSHRQRRPHLRESRPKQEAVKHQHRRWKWASVCRVSRPFITSPPPKTQGDTAGSSVALAAVRTEVLWHVHRLMLV